MIKIVMVIQVFVNQEILYSYFQILQQANYIKIFLLKLNRFKKISINKLNSLFIKIIIFKLKKKYIKTLILKQNR
jgi:hypothetical protein